MPHLPRVKARVLLVRAPFKCETDVMTKDLPAHLVFKITPAEAWTAACAAGRFGGSPDDIRDGFIHLSAGPQLTGTANRYFCHVRNLVLVTFRASDLSDHLRWEPSRGGAVFPHYYGALPVALACWSAPLPLDEWGAPCVEKTLAAIPGGL